MLTSAAVAYADPSAADLQAQGEQLAKDGRYSEAIDAFKNADRLQPTASHACLIALAYTRRELWSQAEIFLARCHERATPSDPLPDWVPVAEQQIAERLATANAAPVTIDVTPAGTPVQLTVSSFAPDESFSPRTIHLAPGTHTIIAEAKGFVTAHQDVTVATKDPQHITIALVVAQPRENLLTHDPVIPRRMSPWSRRLEIGGAIVLGAGLVATGFMSYEYYAAKNSATDFDDHIGTYRDTRIAAISLLAVGGGLAITGYLMRRHDERSIAAVPVPGGAMIAVGWQR